jgi:hypothetical protein
MTKRINEHTKYEYEKPDGALPHMCSECWEWKRNRRGYRTIRNGLAYEKRRCEEYLAKEYNDDADDLVMEEEGA